MIKARLYTFDLKHAYCIKSVILTLITIEELSYLPEKGTICHILNVLKCYSGENISKQATHDFCKNELHSENSYSDSVVQ